MKPDRTRFPSLVASVFLMLAAGGAQAAEPLALQKIMKDLGRHMQTVADGISREDWELVAKTAPLIAEHPQPPFGEKARILGFVGANMGKYKAHDGRTHDAALALGRAARLKDGPGVIAAFAELQTRCHDCHREFRRPFVEHFYGAR